MDQLVATAAFLRKQLAEVEEKIRTFQKETPAADQETLMTIDEMRSEIAEMDADPKWKAFVTTRYGVVDNILTILNDCYYPFVDSIKEGYPTKKPVSILGKHNSRMWQGFQLSVIKRLLNPKDYDEDYNFEDTANGCDEVAWDEGAALIEEIAKSL
jgi:hypothetical protein